MRRLLAHRDARLYLSGQVMSLFGDSALWLAMGIWIKVLTGSSAAAGLSFFALALGSLCGPLGGMLADKVRRRPLLIVTNLATAGLVLLLLLVRDRHQVWLIYTVMFGYGVSGSTLGPAQTALVQAIVPARLLGDANSVLQTAEQGLRLVTPLAGAGLFAAFGPAPVIIGDAVTFLIAAATLLAIRMRENHPVPSGQRWIAELTAGARHIARTVVLRQLTITAAVVVTAYGLSETVLFAVVSQGLHKPAAFLGILISAEGIGAIAAGITAAPLLRWLSESLLASLGMASAALGYLLLIAAASSPRWLCVPGCQPVLVRRRHHDPPPAAHPAGTDGPHRRGIHHRVRDSADPGDRAGRRPDRCPELPDPAAGHRHPHDTGCDIPLHPPRAAPDSCHRSTRTRSSRYLVTATGRPVSAMGRPAVLYPPAIWVGAAGMPANGSRSCPVPQAARLAPRRRLRPLGWGRGGSTPPGSERRRLVLRIPPRPGRREDCAPTHSPRAPRPPTGTCHGSRRPEPDRRSAPACGSQADITATRREDAAPKRERYPSDPRRRLAARRASSAASSSALRFRPDRMLVATDRWTEYLALSTGCNARRAFLTALGVTARLTARPDREVLVALAGEGFPGPPVPALAQW
jgi:MFS family permease